MLILIRNCIFSGSENKKDEPVLSRNYSEKDEGAFAGIPRDTGTLSNVRYFSHNLSFS